MAASNPVIDPRHYYSSASFIKNWARFSRNQDYEFDRIIADPMAGDTARICSVADRLIACEAVLNRSTSARTPAAHFRECGESEIADWLSELSDAVYKVFRDHLSNIYRCDSVMAYFSYAHRTEAAHPAYNGDYDPDVGLCDPLSQICLKVRVNNIRRTIFPLSVLLNLAQSPLGISFPICALFLRQRSYFYALYTSDEDIRRDPAATVSDLFRFKRCYNWPDENLRLENTFLANLSKPECLTAAFASGLLRFLITRDEREYFVADRITIAERLTHV